MKTRIIAAVGVAAAAFLLAGCDNDLYGPGGPATPSDQTGYAREGDAQSIPSESPAPTTSPTAANNTAEGAALMTLDTELGTIVTDSGGRAVYQFDTDTQGSGTSACSDDCLAKWPIVPGGDPAPTLEGISGEVTTITGTDGSPQLALNGWPLYYFAGDSAAGDVNGQAVGGVWWVIGPDGEPIHD